MVNIAQIGIGRWGKNILRNLTQLPNTKLVTVCDLDPKNIEAAKQLYPNLNYTTKMEDVIGSPEIEAVYIATPASTHFELAVKLLKAGKHVFIEKPIVLVSNELEELIELASQQKKIIMEGHLLLYHGAVNAMRDKIRAGLIGDLHHLYFRRTNLGSIRFEANALWDFGPHDISVVYYLIDEVPQSISAHAVGHFPQGTEETVFTTIKFDSGKVAHLHESWIDPHKDRKIIAVGNKGMLVLDELATDGKLKLVKKHVKYDSAKKFEHEKFSYHDEGVEVIEYPECEPLRTECEHFIKAIINNTEVRSNGTNSLRVLRTLENAQRSIDEDGHPVQYQNKKEKEFTHL